MSIDSSFLAEETPWEEGPNTITDYERLGFWYFPKNEQNMSFPWRGVPIQVPWHIRTPSGRLYNESDLLEVIDSENPEVERAFEYFKLINNMDPGKRDRKYIPSLLNMDFIITTTMRYGIKWD